MSPSLKISKRQIPDHLSSPRTIVFSVLIKALRPHQWIKNALVVVPLAMAHKVGETELLVRAVIAFCSFSLCASGVYILNDIFDRESDRQHPTKKHRPFAAGQFSIGAGLSVIPFLLAGSFGLALYYLPAGFSLLLTVYAILTTLYSFRLKRLPILNVLILAGFYVLRVFAGGVAVNVEVSPWLHTFSWFIFLSLALLKRYTELLVIKKHPTNQMQKRGYALQHIDLFRKIGAALGYLAIGVLAFYINSEQANELYTRPLLLWLIAPLLFYWISRMWRIARRGEMHDDPVVFIIKDRNSFAVAGLTATIISAAAW